MATKERDLKLEDVAGNLYVPSEPSDVGLVLGPGILGNRYGLAGVADYIVDQAKTPTIVLDPPSHHKNRQEFTFGNYAFAQRIAAQHLRDEYGVKKVIGGGHSGGPVAGLFANMAYDSSVEAKVIQLKKEECSDYELQEIIKSSYSKPPFDGLIVASLPRNVREATPSYVFNTFVLKLLHLGFKWQNRGNKTNYLGKNEERPFQWKHFATDNVQKIRDYISRAVNPHEYIELLSNFNDAYSRRIIFEVQQTPKLFLVPGRDMINFGQMVNWKKDWGKELSELKDHFKVLGVTEDYYYEFPADAHFLNGRFEADSLYGLQNKRVQQLILSFITRFTKR